MSDEECSHIFNAHAQCQWCHRMRKDIEYDDMKVENAKLRAAFEPTPCEHCSNLAYDTSQGPCSFPACHDCYRKVQAENAKLRAALEYLEKRVVEGVCLFCGDRSTINDEQGPEDDSDG